MSFWLFFIPFGILSFSVYVGISDFYEDIFIHYDHFIEINKHLFTWAQWYNWVSIPFYTGAVLWCCALYYQIQMWRLKLFHFNPASAYLLASYLSLLFMFMTQLAHAPLWFWGMAWAIHIVCLVILIIKINVLRRQSD